MQDHDVDERQEVTDLGAASQKTQGVWAPLMKENHFTPDYRDF